MKHFTGFRTSMGLGLLAAVLAIPACSDGTSGSDRGAATGKADDPDPDAFPLALERATAEEVAATFSEQMSGQLDACFDDYKQRLNPSAVLVTRNVIDALRNNWPAGDCSHSWDLRSTVTDLFDEKSRSQVHPDTIKGWFEPWAVEVLQPSVANGYVGWNNIDGRFYDALQQTRDANSQALETNPAGVDLKQVREQWKEVRSDTTLDRAYLNTVLLDPDTLETNEIFTQLRSAFPLTRLSLQKAGAKAVDEFWNAFEGPDGDPAFAPIADALAQPSIRKRFFFAGGGSEWSSHVLVVVDEDGQAFGFQMGYSE